MYEGDGSEPGNSAPYRGFHWPTFIKDSAESVRCGRDNMNWAAQTEVLTVQAGDSFEIVIDAGDPESWSDDNWYKCPDDRGSCLAKDNVSQLYAENPAHSFTKLRLSRYNHWLTVTVDLAYHSLGSCSCASFTSSKEPRYSRI